MKNVIALILGGGRGTRLYPLTRDRAKPAVPLLGQYRLIDIPISNCLNSDIRCIYVLTQFLTHSLHRHIATTYQFDPFSGSWVHILAAQQTLTGEHWYQGTADAVRQNIQYLLDHGAQHVLILSGDQLYRMDFTRVYETHRQSGARCTICCTPVPQAEAPAVGLVRTDPAGRVTGFAEKSRDPAALGEGFVLTEDELAARGLAGAAGPCLASMGIYLFDTAALIEALEADAGQQDFGREVIPAFIARGGVHAHFHCGYWRDIGTIRSFYEANLAMARPDPPIDLAGAGWTIYSRARFLPPAQIQSCSVAGSIVGGGCRIGARLIEGSVIGLRSVIGRGTVIRDAIMMGADYFETAAPAGRQGRPGVPPLGIGRDCVIEKAIIDKNVRIGNGVQVRARQRPDELDEKLHCVRDGIVVVPRNTVIPDGAVL